MSCIISVNTIEIDLSEGLDLNLDSVWKEALKQEDLSQIQIGDRALNRFHGTNLDDLLSGKRGKDKLYGHGGNDLIDGGKGGDKIYGGDGCDMLFGGSNKDRIRGGSGSDFIDGGKGKDKIFGDSGSDTIIGGSSRDIIDAGDGDDFIYATGRDEITLGTGSDVISLEFFGNDQHTNVTDFNANDKVLIAKGSTFSIGGEGDILIVNGRETLDLGVQKLLESQIEFF